MTSLREISQALVALFIIHSTKAAGQTTVPQLNYSCDGTRVASLETEMTHIYILVDENTSEYCKPENKTLNNCRTKDLPNPLKVIYEEELRNGLIGGKNFYFYELKCAEGQFKLTANANFSGIINVNKKHTDMKNKTTDRHMTLSLTISKQVNGSAVVGSVNIGDELFVILKGPANHSVNPLTCSAVANKQTPLEMWNNTMSCTNDPALIEKEWEGDNSTISIKIYAFRFVASSEVNITCTAMVCPIQGNKTCHQECVTGSSGGGTHGNKRRRNAILTSKSDLRSATASFRVVNNNFSNQATGHQSVTVATMCTVLMTIALLFL